MSWYLEYKHPEAGPQRIELVEGHSLRIGRGSDSDTRIPDTSLSREHCELTSEDAVPTLSD